MTKILRVLLISLSLCGPGGADPVTYPTKAGEYSHNGWKYVYEIQSPGTRSERRIGRLFLNGKEVKGDVGELKQEPIGRFLYFGEGGYHQGWLNTLAYDRSVFDKDGNPTKQASGLLGDRSEKSKKAKQDAESDGGKKSQ